MTANAATDHGAAAATSRYQAYPEYKDSQENERVINQFQNNTPGAGHAW